MSLPRLAAVVDLAIALWRQQKIALLVPPDLLEHRDSIVVLELSVDVFNLHLERALQRLHCTLGLAELRERPVSRA